VSDNNDIRLHIGVLSYANPHKLRKCIEHVQRNSRTSWRMTIAHNPSDGDNDTREVICGAIDRDKRIDVIWLDTNEGYAGGVNAFLRKAVTTPGWNHIAYLDNDAYVMTAGWDQRFCDTLDQHQHIGLLFPNGGPYPIPGPGYTEVLWGVGFCWATTRKAVTEAGFMDATLGHQNEADWALSMRLAGYTIAALPEVSVQHDATATNNQNPANQERINRGVVAWVDKWNRYFNGKQYGYHHPQVTRNEDWPPNALYLERYWRLRFPHLNDNPEVVTVNGQEYDLIKTPRLKFYYRNRG